MEYKCRLFAYRRYELILLEVRLLFYIEERVVNRLKLKRLMIMSVLALSSASIIANAAAVRNR